MYYVKDEIKCFDVSSNIWNVYYKIYILVIEGFSEFCNCFKRCLILKFFFF